MDGKSEKEKKDKKKDDDEIEWDMEDMKQSIIESAEQSWDKFAGG